MRTLKFGQFLTALLISLIMIFCIPFIFDADAMHDKIVFSFDFNYNIEKIRTSGVFSYAVTLIVYKTLYYSLISIGSLHIILNFVTLFVKKRNTKIFVTSIIVLEIVLSFPILIIMSKICMTEFYKSIFIYLVAGLLIVDLLFALVQAVYQIIKIHESTAPQIIVPQKTSEGIVYSADQLEDSIQIKNRIKNLKNGLVTLSYDEAVETIDATGEWNGLNMKDVQEYSYEKEMINNQNELRRINEKEIGGNYNSSNNGIDLDKWKR